MGDPKHLELLQAAIQRLAGNSMLVKGWSVTLASAFLGLAVKDGQPCMALAGLLPVAIFWVLDAYYLAIERGMRELSDGAVALLLANKAPTYAMKPAPVSNGTIARCMVRRAVWLTHLPLVPVLVAAWWLG